MQYTLSSTIRSSTLEGNLYNVKSWQIDLKPRIERALSVSTFSELSDASFTINALKRSVKQYATIDEINQTNILRLYFGVVFVLSCLNTTSEVHNTNR